MRALTIHGAICIAVSLWIVPSCATTHSAVPDDFTGFADYLDFASVEAQIDWSRNRQIAVEELTRDCMMQQGFEYELVPFDVSLVPLQAKPEGTWLNAVSG
ncbi:MAG: hypothetical protein ACFCVK_23130 [Acidimicrobiales bacterium]